MRRVLLKEVAPIVGDPILSEILQPIIRNQALLTTANQNS